MSGDGNDVGITATIGSWQYVAARRSHGSLRGGYWAYRRDQNQGVRRCETTKWRGRLRASIGTCKLANLDKDSIIKECPGLAQISSKFRFREV